jgi:hypothetical protein
MSNGIDFVIGGTDKAGPVVGQVEKSLARLEKRTESLASSTKLLTRITGTLTAAYVAVKAGIAMLGGLDAINAAYDKQADAVRGLETSLRLQGEEVSKNSERLQAFAGNMQKLTGLGDEATVAFMKQASMMGVNADKLEDVTKASVGLAEVTGQSLESAFAALQKAQEGNFAAFEKQFPQMKAMQSEEEKLAFVTQMAAKGLEAKADASKTVSGMAERASGAIGDLMEVIGQIIAPVRMLINQGLKTLAESLQQVLAPAAEYAQSVLENIGPIMDYVKEKVVQAVNAVVAAFTFVEVIVTNLGSVWELMKATAELAFESMKNNIIHVLTEVIPTYAAWFAENFVNIIRDGLMLAVTVVTNHVRKLIDLFAAFWDFIKSGGSSDILGTIGEIAGRSYLEGFESSLTALPDIASRSITDAEQELANKIGAISGDLGAQFAKKFGERMVSLDDTLGADFNKEIDIKLNKKIEEKTGLVGKSGGGDQTLSASESRLLTRGPSDRRTELMEQMAAQLNRLIGVNEAAKSEAAAATNSLAEIAENTSQTTRLVPAL